MRRPVGTTWGRVLFGVILGAILPLASPAAAGAQPAPGVPLVYADPYLAIRAGIAGLEGRILHLGDVVPLVVSVSFAAQGVRVETLNADLFHRAWGAEPSVHLYGDPVVTTAKEGPDRVEVRAVYRFQILGCPGETSSCPGPKLFPLPRFALAYQVLDEAGGVAVSRAPQFRPWPGEVVLVTALPWSGGALGSFASYFPDGGYPDPLAPRPKGVLGFGLVAFGTVAFLAGALLPLRARRGRLRPASPYGSPQAGKGGEWERILLSLRPGALPGDRFADALRRVVVGYCREALSENPFAWPLLHHEGHGPDEEPPAIRTFFWELLHETAPDAGRQADLLARFAEIVQGREVKGRQAKGGPVKGSKAEGLEVEGGKGR